MCLLAACGYSIHAAGLRSHDSTLDVAVHGRCTVSIQLQEGHWFTV